MLSRRFIRGFATSLALCKSVKLNKKAKTVSSHQWLQRQLTDPFVEKAKMANYRCRSAFKLIEIDDRFQVLKPGHVVIDCGAAPGSWTQVAVQRVNSDESKPDMSVGKVISIDKQQIYPVKGALICGGMDFTKPESQKKVIEMMDGNKAHAVISDMAPSASGVRDLDTENILNLCYAALRFAVQVSLVDASLIVKLWQCGEIKQLETDIGRFYSSVKPVKPSASRADSAEIFLLARNFKGLKT